MKRPFVSCQVCQVFCHSRMQLAQIPPHIRCPNTTAPLGEQTPRPWRPLTLDGLTDEIHHSLAGWPKRWETVNSTGPKSGWENSPKKDTFQRPTEPHFQCFSLNKWYLVKADENLSGNIYPVNMVVTEAVMITRTQTYTHTQFNNFISAHGEETDSPPPKHLLIILTQYVPSTRSATEGKRERQHISQSRLLRHPGDATLQVCSNEERFSRSAAPSK